MHFLFPKPGDCIVLHMNIAHTPTPVPGDRRMCLVTRWAGDDAIIADRSTSQIPQETSYPDDMQVGEHWVKSKKAIIPWVDGSNKSIPSSTFLHLTKQF